MNKLIVVAQNVVWGSMRILRSTWVLLTNGTAIYLLCGSTQQVTLLNHLLEQDNRNKALWFHFGLKATIPILGILLEFLGSRFAKWVNVGYFVFVGIVFSTISIWAWSDYHGRIYLLLGLPALGVAGVSYLLYRRPRPTPAASPTSQR
jgi:hypothetical protein